MADQRLDVLILGVTGFTGMHCVPYLYKFAKENGRNLSWGVSGRSKKKINEVLDQIGKKIGADLSDTPIVISDINEYDSLVKMAQRTKIVINCCGPYSYLGEPVVKACISAGTNYVDASGEPQFMENMAFKYHQAAREKGLYIVSSCGLDSIHCDLGLIYFEDKFDGVLNSVVTYMETWNDGSISGPVMNYGTWQSIVYGIQHPSELSQLHEKLYPTKLPTFTPELQMKKLPHRPKVVDGWALPFPGADRSVMCRTQRYLYENENKRPVQVDTLVRVKSFLETFSIICGYLLWALLVKFNFGKNLLLNYPQIFTFGMFEKDELPSTETINNTWFQLTLYAEGWKEKLANKDDQYKTPPNKSLVARVKGRNPAYGATCVCLVGSAITILLEKDRLPKNGGVYTPGIAFGNTSLVQLLKTNGISFDILSEKDL